MKDEIARLKREADHHRQEAKNREDAIKAFQKVCAHDFEPDGHDSHYDYRKCAICGKQERC